MAPHQGRVEACPELERMLGASRRAMSSHDPVLAEDRREEGEPMRWTTGDRGNVEDLRGRSGGMRAVPMGIGGVVVLLLLSWATGVDFMSLAGGGGNAPSASVGTTGTGGRHHACGRKARRFRRRRDRGRPGDLATGPREPVSADACAPVPRCRRHGRAADSPRRRAARSIAPAITTSTSTSVSSTSCSGALEPPVISPRPTSSPTRSGIMCSR